VKKVNDNGNYASKNGSTCCTALSAPFTRKVRLVADYVRGMNVRMALDKLKFTNHAAALDVSKVITSAAANLKDRFQDELIEDENLKIKTITVDEGPTLKRIQPAPQGRAHPIRKRSCHITVVVTAASTQITSKARRNSFGTKDKSYRTQTWNHPRMGLQLVY
jgi:large subunit ribosomal protein L22